MNVGGRFDDREEKTMKQDLWSIIEEMEAVVTDGVHLPLSDGVVISEREIFALLDELRAVLPEELSEARALVEERDRILSEARSQAERTLEDAAQRAERMTDESTITSLAEEQAEETVEEAEEVARKIKLQAHQYADDVLRQLQQVLNNATDRIAEGREQLSHSSQEMRRAPDQVAAARDDSDNID